KELGDLRPRDRRSGIGQQQEKVSYALEGAAGRLFSLLQSTIQLAKSQMQLNKLEISKVWITGGTASAKGLDDYLAASLGVPVQRFDPLGDAGVVVQGAAQSCEMTVALGLGVMAADAQAWSLEILAARERAKREFARRHVFTVLALLLVLGYLGLAWWRWSDDHEKAVKVHDGLQAEQKKRKKNAQ